jgi:hypothetical protein
MADFKSDRWVNGHGVVGGREAFIRKNISLQAICKANYPTLLMVSLIYHEQTASGLPSSHGELDRLDITEEAIADRFCAKYAAQYALCVTAGGTRDLFLFLPGKHTEQEIAAEFDSCSPSVDFDFALRHDPAWRPYVAMLPDSAGQAAASAPQASWWKRLWGS